MSVELYDTSGTLLAEESLPPGRSFTTHGASDYGGLSMHSIVPVVAHSIKFRFFQDVSVDELEVFGTTSCKALVGEVMNLTAPQHGLNPKALVALRDSLFISNIDQGGVGTIKQASLPDAREIVSVQGQMKLRVDPKTLPAHHWTTLPTGQKEREQAAYDAVKSKYLMLITILFGANQIDYLLSRKY